MNTELESSNTPQETEVQGRELVIRYMPEASLDKCMFVARRGNLEVKQSADKLLSGELQKTILAKEAAGKVEYGVDDYDITKGKVDVKVEEGREKAQPGDLTKGVGGGVDSKIVQDYDVTKGKIDKKIEEGKEPIQPSQVVSKYASAIGGKVAKLTEDPKTGAVEAILVGGSVVRLAQIWNTKPTLIGDESTKTAVKKEAKITGEQPVLSRESVEAIQDDPRDTTNMLARETPDPVAGAKPSGSGGGEVISYYGQHDRARLTETGDGWARKVASLQAKVAEVETENKLLKATLEKTKKAQEDEKRSLLVKAIMQRLSEAGALQPDQGEILELKDQGLEHDDAVAKATANAKDKQLKELASLDVVALEKLHGTIQKFATTNRTAEPETPKSLDLPITEREDAASSDTLEDKLASSW